MSPAEAPNVAPIPLSVLTGFLGSGKTTLLNALLKHPVLANAAVIINEFGEIGIDHLLVETADETIMEMSSGCLCCTIRSDLINTLDDLLRRRDDGTVQAFERVVIETTGLADPAPVLHTIMNHPYLVQRYRLESVISTVDCANAMATLDTHEESVKQAAVADRIVLTKTDLVSRDQESAVRGRLATLNPAARILDAHAGEAVPDVLFDAGLYNVETKAVDVSRWLADEAYEQETHARSGGQTDHGRHGHDHGHTGHGHAGHTHDPNRHDDRIKAYCVTSNEPIGINSFSLFMELLQSYHGPNLLRVKGIVKLIEQPDRPVVIHGVQHVFHPPVELDHWPGGDERTRLVFITRDIEKKELEALLKAFTQKISLDATVFQYDETLSTTPKGGAFD